MMLTILIICCLWLFAVQSLAWHDKTHIAVAKTAGYDMWYNAAAPDLAKLKAGKVETLNHYYNNNSGVEITPDLVLAQAKEYNSTRGEEGHLYGAIIGSLRAYVKYLEGGKHAEYHLAYAAHYIGDLSMQLHNIPYDHYNKSRHVINDGIVENVVLSQTEKIRNHMYDIRLSDDNFEADLAREVARIANLSRQLGYKLQIENRDMTQDEAYDQLGHSVSLFKAVLQKFKKI